MFNFLMSINISLFLLFRMKNFLVASSLLLSFFLLLLSSLPVRSEVASVLYRNNKLILSPGIENSEGVAVGKLDDTIDQNGWAFLGIKTNTNFPSEIQYRAAGFLEGYLSATYMDQYAANQFENWGYTPSTSPPSLQDFMTANLDFMRHMKPKKGGDAIDIKIVEQVKLLVEQFDGIVEGYTYAKDTKNFSFSFPKMEELDIFYLNAAGDLETLNDVFTYSGRVKKRYYGDDTMLDCSAFIRTIPLEEGGALSDMVVAHTTWRPYNLMNRIYKILSIDGKAVSFSSSPGFICSKDDYYVTDQNLVVYETTNNIYDTDLYSLLTPKSLLSFVRPVLANRLSSDGDMWTEVCSRYNSGTYNNQWGVINFNLFSAFGMKEVPAGTLWIIEQVPGFSQRGDVSQVLNTQGYFASYNIPYFKDIYNLCGYPTDNPKYSYSQCPRARIFAERAPEVFTMEDAKELIRYNEYTTDPLSMNDPANAIASRYDLRTSGAKPFGAIDGKLSSFMGLFPWGFASMNSTLQVVAISGPTAQDPSVTPPFSWADPAFSDTSHVGLPEVWDFQYVTVERKSVIG